ncbi:MAG: hypothetical protein ACI9W4_000252 [Rhodothermales bacterium]|jgi:hypothetical protein
MLPSCPEFPTTFTDPADRLAWLGHLSGQDGQAPGFPGVRNLGMSEEGRPVWAATVGSGPRTATLISGSHADEPVGTETLLFLLREVIRRPSEFRRLLSEFTLTVIPQVNPDGEARNQSWVNAWPSLSAYLQEVCRELPGRDIEFGYPDLRVENRLVAGAMKAAAPLHLHMSLHGMGLSGGAMLLIDRYWAFRTEALRNGFREAAASAGLPMHDHNRKGEKGFFQIEPGFTTTPEGTAMRAFFESRLDPETAARFRDSSMEFARHLGGDPLCVVTELPLFLVRGASRPGIPDAYLAFRAVKKEALAAVRAGADPVSVFASLPAEPLPLETAVQLQWEAVSLSLDTVSGWN